MAFRFLTAGDIHLGRQPSRLPQDLDARQFSPRRVWEVFVDTAVSLNVDAIVLTGDVVDQDNRFFEAFSALQAGVQKLVDNSIQVIAVAGNHDYTILPRLAAQIEGFHLLGRGGNWESVSLTSSSGTVVRFVGWSFPDRYVTENPMTSFRPLEGSIPTVGVLHCDCQVKTSCYAPVPLGDLSSSNVDIWALGHIHTGGILNKERPVVFYPGSLQGLDPGERGAHGAWLVTLGADEPPRLELKPLATLQWEHIEIHLDGVDTVAAVEQTINAAIRNVNQSVSERSGGVKTVGCRLRFTGRTKMHRAMPSIASRLMEEYHPLFDGTSYFVEKVEDYSRPEVVLDELARSNDPVGLLAQLLIVLDSREETDTYMNLLSEARKSITEQMPTTRFASLEEASEPLTDDVLREILLQSGFSALDQLLAQREATE